jgi:phospholipid transport system transporter-binding protein
MLILPAIVTSREARDTQRMLSQALQQGVQKGDADLVTVDASGLQHFDSAALAVLMECQRGALGFGKRFAVRQPPAKLVSLARLYGVEQLLMFDASPAAASPPAA